MELIVLNSNSSGNCYLFKSKDEVLVLEAGVKFIEVQKSLRFNIRNIKGVLCSHHHGDHFKYASDFAKFMIPVYCSKETSEKAKFKTINFDNLKSFKVGKFSIIPFDVEHDCPGTYGFVIIHEECGHILFATDTYYLKYNFPNIEHMLMEANYSSDLLNERFNTGEIEQRHRDRVMKSHMSLSTCKMVVENHKEHLKNLILIHLSSGNSNEKRFIQEFDYLNIPVHVAKKGLNLIL